MLVRELITVYSANCMGPICTLCEQNTEFLKVNIGGTFSYQWTLKGYVWVVIKRRMKQLPEVK
jgi:hypothetical protein